MQALCCLGLLGEVTRRGRLSNLAGRSGSWLSMHKHLFFDGVLDAQQGIREGGLGFVGKLRVKLWFGALPAWSSFVCHSQLSQIYAAIPQPANRCWQPLAELGRPQYDFPRLGYGSGKSHRTESLHRIRSLKI